MRAQLVANLSKMADAHHSNEIFGPREHKLEGPMDQLWIQWPEVVQGWSMQCTFMLK